MNVLNNSLRAKLVQSSCHYVFACLITCSSQERTKYRYINLTSVVMWGLQTAVAVDITPNFLFLLTSNKRVLNFISSW